MPVRIYEISKKLGLANKDVLAKAKALDIPQAKVASSSLDKITAEYLEQQLRADHPELEAPTAAPEPESAPTALEPIVIVSAPEAAEPVAASQPEAAPEPEPALVVEATVQPVETQAEARPLPPPQISEEEAEPELVVAKGPRIGEKVGFIKLTPPLQRQRPWERPRKEEPPRQPQPARPEDRISRGPQPVRGPLPGRKPGKPAGPPPAESKREPEFKPPTTGEIIRLKPPVVIRELAEQIRQKPFSVIATLMELGIFATVNQAIDELAAQKVCAKFGFRFELEKRDRTAKPVVQRRKEVELDFEDKPEDLKPRPPVVTIMGHVDHGKTTLLDVIRKSNVVAGEAGGITQHIGAYTISFPHPDDKKRLQQITFLDTPGHAAFSSMRARGADVTDIVVLVVAANDGVMPQTLEALNHAKAANVPIMVAVNKCDLPGANPLRVRQQLQDKGLTPDEWGGETIYVDCSAVAQQGVDKLIEMILLQADLLELKANPNRRAMGNVIESGLEPGGPTATVLVRKGTLKVGDVMICGHFYGRVRALISEEGTRMKSAGPSHAVKVLGVNGVPEAGLEFVIVDNERAARELAEKRGAEFKADQLEARSRVTLENLFDTLAAQQSKALKVIVKADTQGSVEAIVSELGKIQSEKVALEVVHAAVGTVTESDVLLAAASKAVVLGFHTRVDSGVSETAKHHGVQVKLYAIIYELVDEIKLAMAGLLEPVLKEVVTGTAEIRKIFELSKGVPVAGCMVTSGRIARGKVRVRRHKELIYEGITQSLRRFQDEVNEVRAGMECGIRIDGFGEFVEGDLIECYTLEKVAQTL
ncbi:MAG: translation initiation factor IF-2 [Verrucomicrobia bacterium]|jgi:translation initiation factor IF-2|nr:translation initiation factor IF-2 [Verrucomicrobiota bacterium]